MHENYAYLSGNEMSMERLFSYIQNVQQILL